MPTLTAFDRTLADFESNPPEHQALADIQAQMLDAKAAAAAAQAAREAKVDKKQLAAVRKLIGASDTASVLQGIELLRTLNTVALWQIFADGVKVTRMPPGASPKPYAEQWGLIDIADGHYFEHSSKPPCELWKRVKPDHRLTVALWALSQTGNLEGLELLTVRKIGWWNGNELKNDGVWSLTNVDALRGLTSLRELELPFCRSLTNLDGLKGMVALEKLSLYGCSSLTNLDALQGLVGLRELNLCGCRALKDVDALATLTGLKKLQLWDGWPLDSLRAKLQAAIPGLEID